MGHRQELLVADVFRTREPIDRATYSKVVAIATTITLTFDQEINGGLLLAALFLDRGEGSFLG